MAQILAAVAPDTEERVRRILDGHDVMFARDLSAAQAALQSGGVHLVFVGARFDQSRMFDLLEYLRQDAALGEIPIVAAIVAPTRMAQSTVSGLAHTTKILGASVFVNLNDVSDDEVGNARIRLIVDALIAAPDDLRGLKAALPPRA